MTKPDISTKTQAEAIYQIAMARASTCALSTPTTPTDCNPRCALWPKQPCEHYRPSERPPAFWNKEQRDRYTAELREASRRYAQQRKRP